jgi:hypothetical protein
VKLYREEVERCDVYLLFEGQHYGHEDKAVALARAAVEKKQWPYEWVEDAGYASPADRGAVHGQLVVMDPQQTIASAANAWVRLAATPYTGVDGNQKPYPIMWQIDGKYYQY